MKTLTHEILMDQILDSRNKGENVEHFLTNFIKEYQSQEVYFNHNSHSLTDAVNVDIKKIRGVKGRLEFDWSKGALVASELIEEIFNSELNRLELSTAVGLDLFSRYKRG